MTFEGQTPATAMPADGIGPDHYVLTPLMNEIKQQIDNSIYRGDEVHPTNVGARNRFIISRIARLSEADIEYMQTTQPWMVSPLVAATIERRNQSFMTQPGAETVDLQLLSAHETGGLSKGTERVVARVLAYEENPAKQSVKKGTPVAGPLTKFGLKMAVAAVNPAAAAGLNAFRLQKKSVWEPAARSNSGVENVAEQDAADTRGSVVERDLQQQQDQLWRYMSGPGVLLATSSMLSASRPSLAMRRGTYSTDTSDINYYLAINAHLTTAQQAALPVMWRSSYASGPAHYVSRDVDRHWQASALQRDDREPNLTPLSHKGLRAGAFGFVGLDIGIAADVYDVTQSNLINYPVGFGAAAALAAVALGVRHKRGFDGYTLKDLEKRSREASEAIAAPEAGGLKILDEPVTFTLNTEQVAAVAAATADAPYDVQTRPNEQELSVWFGSLFKSMILQHTDPVAAREAWVEHYFQKAVAIQALLDDYRTYQKHLKQQLAVDEFNKTAAFPAEDDGLTAELQAIVDSYGQEIAARYVDLVTSDPEYIKAAFRARQLNELTDDIYRTTNGGKSLSVNSNPLRKVAAVAARQLDKSVDTSIRTVGELGYYLNQIDTKITSNAQLPGFYKAMRREFAGRLELPEWEIVARDFNLR